MERQAVEDIEPACENSVGMFGPQSIDEFADETGSVFEASAILTWPTPRGEQFIQQVAMALFEVNEVESDLKSNPRAAA